MKDFNNKKIVKIYKKNGFTVKVYKPMMSEKERLYRDGQIKNDVINVIKDLSFKIQ